MDNITIETKDITKIAPEDVVFSFAVPRVLPPIIMRQTTKQIDAQIQRLQSQIDDLNIRKQTLLATLSK